MTENEINSLANKIDDLYGHKSASLMPGLVDLLEAEINKPAPLVAHKRLRQYPYILSFDAYTKFAKEMEGFAAVDRGFQNCIFDSTRRPYGVKVSFYMLACSMDIDNKGICHNVRATDKKAWEDTCSSVAVILLKHLPTAHFRQDNWQPPRGVGWPKFSFAFQFLIQIAEIPA